MNGTEVPPLVVAAIDVGTNSIHMVVARATSPGFEVLAREKSVVRLGAGGGRMVRLGDEAIERGVVALRQMRRVADAHGAVVRAVATSAVREAANADAFLERARDEAGIAIEVISGVEEARLIHLGAMQALPISDGNRLLIDIGGGSTELVVSRRGHILFAQSLKMGAVRFTDRFLPDDRVSKEQERDLRRHAASSVAAVAHEIRHLGFDSVVISSGTAEALCRIALARRGDTPQSINGCVLRADELDAILGQLLECAGHHERASIPGLDPRRADIIVAGASILREIVRSLGIEAMVYSDFALREGVLLDSIQRLDPAAGVAVDGAERDSTMQLARRCSVDLERAAHISGLALAIWRGLTPLHGFDSRCEPLLESASMLWSAGLAVSHSRYHHHSYYIVRNADLMGFSDTQIEIIALVCRYHRKGHPKPSHGGYDGLDREEQRLVGLLAGILRIAIALDRSHGRSALIAATEITPGAIRVCVSFGDAPPDAADLDLYAARERSDLLAEALNTPVEIIQRP